MWAPEYVHEAPCLYTIGGVGQARAHELRLNGDSHTAGLINYDDQSWISAISHTDASANVSIELVRGSQSVYEVSIHQVTLHVIMCLV